MAWAELSHSKLSVDPAEVAAQYKKASAGGGYVDYKEFDQADRPKKKVAYAQGLELIGRYMTYTDTDANAQKYVNNVWVQAILDYGTGSGEGNWSGTDIQRTNGGQGSVFSAEALAECRAYVEGIQNSKWGCMQHMAADYLAHVIAAGEIKDTSDASRAAWFKKLASSDYAKKFRFIAL